MKGKMIMYLFIITAIITFAAGIVVGWLSLSIMQAKVQHKTHLEFMEEFKNENK
jgi:hypothetical protein